MDGVEEEKEEGAGRRAEGEGRGILEMLLVKSVVLRETIILAACFPVMMSMTWI